MISFNFLHCNLNFNINTNYNKIEIFILRIIMNSLNLNNKYLFLINFGYNELTNSNLIE